MADVSKVNVNSTDYNIKDSNAMHRGVDRVTAGQLSGSTLGTRATAEGYDITASGLNSHGEGSGTTAEGENSHAEGNWTFATGFASHTEGEATHATQSYSHAEGYYSTASGNSSHAEGYYNTASGNFSHAEGFYNTASGNSSHAEGYQTKASSAYQHVEGKYNVEDANGTYAHIIGGGTANNARKNIFTVDWNGNACDGTENRLLPFKAVSEAEYAALSQAEKTNGTAYFRYEATGVMREIQDNGSAASLISGALPTGQTIESYLNSNLGNVKTKFFSNTNTFTFDLDYVPSATSHFGLIILFNMNNAQLGQYFVVMCNTNPDLLELSTSTFYTLTATKNGKVITITSNSTVWGVTIGIYAQR